MKKTLIFLTIILSVCISAFASGTNSKPIIGILCNETNNTLSSPKTYSDIVNKYGGIALIIPTTSDEATIDSTLKWVDGLIIPCDNHSSLNECEKTILQKASKSQVSPILCLAGDSLIKNFLTPISNNQTTSSQIIPFPHASCSINKSPSNNENTFKPIFGPIILPNNISYLQCPPKWNEPQSISLNYVDFNIWSTISSLDNNQAEQIIPEFLSKTIISKPINEKLKRSQPIIGISCSNDDNYSSLSKSYSDAVIQTGGIAVLIPASTDSLTLRATIKLLDGIILSGGGDIHPSYFGERPIEELGYVDPDRDIYDMCLIRMAAQHNIPMLGICRGEQLINVAFGGTLYQDLPSQYKNALLPHRNTTHTINVSPNTWIAKMAKSEPFTANTYHHQAVKKVAKGFITSACSDDGVIEVIENVEGYPIWGVQFHPEKMIADGDKVAKNIFEFFIKKSQTFRHAKELHTQLNFISIDTHTDSPLDFKGNYTIANRGKYLVDIPKMQEGYLDAQYLACWVRQGELTNAGRLNAKNRVDKLITRIENQVSRNSTLCGIARNTEDIFKLKNEGKKAFLIGIENGYAIGQNLSLIEEYHNKGVTYITLCHTKNNDICDSSSDKAGAKWNGLSPFGKEVVAEMNRLGILIDLSHASDDTFWDVLNISEVPVFASHSSSRAMYNCDRNLSDEQLRAIAEKGGVAQACLVDEFLTANPKEATLEHYMEHLYHMIEIAGIDHVGIGSDFDGGAGVKGCNGDNDMIQITMHLIEHGYSDEDIAKIWGGNFIRVLKEAQNHAQELPSSESANGIE